MSTKQINDRSRELILFFTLTFIISWVIWFLAPLISFGDVLLFIWICLIGAFGPSISALLLASRKASHHENNQKKKKWITFCIIFIITSFLSIFITFIFYPITSLIFIIPIIIASFIASFLISSMFSSNSGILDLLKSIKGVKGKNYFLLIAFFLPILFEIVAVLISLILGANLYSFGEFFLTIAIYPLIFSYLFFFGGPLNEEIGWRGFATPRLQEKYSPLITGLIIGVIWSVWHTPLHFNGFYAGGLQGFLLRFIYNIPFGIIFTWYYNKSQANLLGAIILHFSINTYFGTWASLYIPNAYIYTLLIYILFTIFIIIYEKMWKKFPIKND